MQGCTNDDWTCQGRRHRHSLPEYQYYLVDNFSFWQNTKKAWPINPTSTKLNLLADDRMKADDDDTRRQNNIIINAYWIEVPLEERCECLFVKVIINSERVLRYK